ncbi:LysR family transcriptional regulator [Jannaschia sp. S6380]|uniref:LysR family transcriptional regulator n=1 Tax=Jannaschia sp. S6380 TaxID=2926408 RepID=UPI001FF319A3|nr:LysR family transcriptional regulator [Jannaschia sp. S6380]MCK0166209.1 LysR family transcriptional regulator [Jannaschia sp. S6380]
MELRQLRYFVAVADAGSISAAARELGVSQPTISDRIRALEDSVKSNLFERQPRGMRLTFAGRHFLVLARRIVTDVDEASNFAERTARIQVGTLSLGFYTSLANGPFRQTLKNFRDASPDVTLELHEGNPTELLAALRERHIELAITVLDVSATGFETQTLWDEDLVVAIPSAHALAKKDSITWADLEGQPIVMRSWASGSAPYDLLPGRISPDGYVPTERHFVSREALLGIVGLDMGLTVIGGSAIGLSMPGIVLKPMSGPDVTLPVMAVWLPGNDNPARGRFVAMLRDWQPRAAQSPQA